MTGNTFSTPLSAIRGVVLDTETTGLDSRTARIVQIGAVRVEGGDLRPGETFETLVNPGQSIPAQSSAVHGITDAHVNGAPAFADVADALQQFLGTAIVIGHTIGFDLAMLERESSLAKRSWQTPRSLDVRVLAELALPTLAQYDLDRIAAALGIAIDGRHTAMGDAVATARTYAALLPLLRQRGIRTLAEADAGGRSLADRYAAAQRAFQAPVTAAAAPVAVLARIDSFPYRHRISDVMSRPPVLCSADRTVGDVMHLLLERKISSVIVTNGEDGPGIVTERDLLRGLDRLGAAGFDQPVGQLQSRPLHSVRDDAFVYRAIGRIERLGIRHLGVVDGDNAVVGVVTTRNLLRHRATTAIVLGDEIDAASSSAALGSAWSKLPLMAGSLMAESVDLRTVAAVISTEVCALTKRAAELAEARLAAAGEGRPPVPYALLVLGSGGRGESLLAADQDNAIVYASGEKGGAEDKWFERLGLQVADTLDEVGIPYCKGGVMAKNAQWRHSERDWKILIESWVRRQRPEDLLSVDIFFDSIVVHGDTALGERVLAHAFHVAKQSRDFLLQLSATARQWRTPLSWFGGFRPAADGRVDLKKSGLFPIVASVRAIAIKHGIREQSTAARLRAISDLGVGSASDLDTLTDAHRDLLGAVLSQQLIDGEMGVALSTKVEVRRLSAEAKRQLKGALGHVGIATDLAGEGTM